VSPIFIFGNPFIDRWGEAAQSCRSEYLLMGPTTTKPATAIPPEAWAPFLRLFRYEWATELFAVQSNGIGAYKVTFGEVAKDPRLVGGEVTCVSEEPLSGSRLGGC
jgi:hypothetical protein